MALIYVTAVHCAQGKREAIWINPAYVMTVKAIHEDLRHDSYGAQTMIEMVDRVGYTLRLDEDAESIVAAIRRELASDRR